MPKLWDFKVPRLNANPRKRMQAKRLFKSHKHEWEEITRNPQYLKEMRNVVAAIKRKHDDPNLDILKIKKPQVYKFIKGETRVWRCKTCGLIIYSDDLPDEDGAT